MNYRWLTAGTILTLAIVAGGLSYLCFHRSIPVSSGQDHDALTWVRQEFKLSGAKLAQVEAMHEAYELVCAEHCRAIAESREQLQRLRAANGSPAAIATAIAKVEAVDAECIASTEAHIKKVAAVIGGVEGRRYLSIVFPRVVRFGHAAPATLDMRPASTHDHAPGR